MVASGASRFVPVSVNDISDAVHLDALDAQIRALRLHRAVLTVVVKRAAGTRR
jgi:hypothetical protein